MTEQIVQMGPMLILAGLAAGWLTATVLVRRGAGLIVDMALGVGAGLVGGGALLALSGRPAGMFLMFVVGFVLATGVILAQRLFWPCAAEEWERNAHLRLVGLGRPSPGPSGLPGIGEGRTSRAAPARPLARMATTGIYLLRGVPLELQRSARSRAASEGTTLRQVLLKGLGEYAAGTWTPEPDRELPVAMPPAVRATSR